MIVCNLKNTQILSKITNWKPQLTYFVDDSYTKGLDIFKFGQVLTGKSNEEDKPVISYAGAESTVYTAIGDAPITIPAGKAIGLIYEGSPKDMYGRKDNVDDERKLFPYGRRTEKAYALMPEGVLEITDTEEMWGTGVYFRALDKELATAESFDDATATIVFVGNVNDVRVEEKLLIDGDFYWVIDITYNDVTDRTTFTLNAGAGDVVEDIVVKSQLFEDVYLTDDMTGNLPFTMLPKKADNTTDRQKLGFVESTIAVRFNTGYGL